MTATAPTEVRSLNALLAALHADSRLVLGRIYNGRHGRPESGWGIWRPSGNKPPVFNLREGFAPVPGRVARMAKAEGYVERDPRHYRAYRLTHSGERRARHFAQEAR